ncbi:AfsR/SARP family transcriptional regulator [Actinophytocola sediminis]
MEFRLLGPLEVAAGGAAVRVGGLRQRTLLGLLLLQRGQVVSIERLVDAVWATDPPSSARDQVRNGVWALRKALGDKAGRLVVTEDAGYRLDTSRCLVDADQFAEGVRAGRAAAGAGDQEQACSELRAALALWRGPVLAGIPSRLVRQAATGLTEQRLTATEERLDAELAMGRHTEIVGELAELVAEYPERTRLLGQLMRALHGAGRAGEALGAYRKAKHRLADELGLDPPAELVALEAAILRNEPAHDRAPTDDGPGRFADAVANAVANAAPRTLPYDVPDFTGRLAEIRRLLVSGPDAGTVAIRTIEGMAGVGKTALAVHAAHALADRFPDGQLFIDLHGFTPDRAPTSPERALETLLRAIGVPGSRIPSSVDEQVGLWRTELAGRRMVLVLDNAADSKQVSPLIPGSPGVLLLVTSRRRLTSLDGAVPLELAGLAEADAIALVTAIVGAARADAEPGAVAELVELCGRLPLAIRIAAARMQRRPQWTIQSLVDRMVFEKRRLVSLPAGVDKEVMTAFTLSYQALPAEQRRLFRLLGLHPGTDIDVHAAAALADLDADVAEAALEQLTDEYLLNQVGRERYTFHDLLRAHANRCAEAEESPAARHEALTRLFDHYRYAAAQAIDLIDPHERNRRPRLDRPDSYQSPFRQDAAAAAEWLEQQTSNLLTVGAHDGWPTHTGHLSSILWRYLEQQARHQEAQALHQHAVTVAHAGADQLAEAAARRNLGRSQWYVGNLNDAARDFEQALALLAEHEYRLGMVITLNDLGTTLYQLGRHEEADAHCQRALAISEEEHDDVGRMQVLMTISLGYALRGDNKASGHYLRQALAIAQEVGNRNIEGRAHLNMGDLYAESGEPELAEHHLERALSLYREVGNREGEAAALTNLGGVLTRLGRHAEATEHLERALDFFRRNGDRRWASATLREIGLLHANTGRHDQAARFFDEALRLARQIGNLALESIILNCLGDNATERGVPREAGAHHQQALLTARRSGQPLEEANAHRGLGRAHHALGEPAEASRHCRRALDLYTELDADDVTDLRALLTTLDAAK